MQSLFGIPQSGNGAGTRSCAISYKSFRIEKLLSGYETTGKGPVAFMGGYITEGSGWREKVSACLQQMFPKTAFEFINAGFISAGSAPGVFRLYKYVLSHGSIDLLF